jgi:hypothetical protein
LASAAGLPWSAARWHLIGRLQRNKVRRTLPLVSLLHSLDSRRLLGPGRRDLPGPTPHEVVGRAVRSALEAREHARWWQYAVWGDLPFPNVYVPLTPGDTERALYALGAYSGENERNDYRDLVSGGWVRGRALGAEKVFGFGARRPVEARAVELATEVIWDGAWWRFGVARVFAPDAALPAGSDDDATEWVRAQSVSALRPVPGPQPTAS